MEIAALEQVLNLKIYNVKNLLLSFLGLLFIAHYSCKSGKEIQAFTTDGCSCFPDGDKQNKELWHHCCVAHDSLYWKGGSRSERKTADSLLCDCVTKSGNPATSKRMYIGVRLGGGAWLPTPWRWGYGYPYGHGYQ